MYSHKSLSGPGDVDRVTDVEGQRIEEIASVPVLFCIDVNIVLLALTLKTLTRCRSRKYSVVILNVRFVAQSVSGCSPVAGIIFVVTVERTGIKK